jgi:hypothetical protein
MSEPIVMISHHRIREGKLDEFRKSYRQATKMLEAEKPETVGFLHYLDEDEGEVTSVHVLPDAEAMERHLEGVGGAGGRGSRAFQFLEPGRVEIYGKPSDKAMEFMKKSAAEYGYSLSVKPEYVAGYLRLSSG